MRRFIFPSLAFFLLLCFLVSPAICLSEPFIKNNDITANYGEQIEKGVVKEWTFMLYDDADFDPQYDIFNEFVAEAYSGDNLNVVVLQDTFEGPAKLWYINDNHTATLLEEKGELNMGDYVTLRDFIEYCKASFPAERYIMDFYNHGAGWIGSCRDDTSDGDLLSMDEMQQALDETGGIDIIIFNAPCLMGTIECAYELRDCVDVYIASEELCGYKFGLAGLLCDLLESSPFLDSLEVGKRFIGFVENLGGSWAPRRTMSAVRTDKMENLAEGIHILAKDFIKKWLGSYNQISLARSKTFQFGETKQNMDRFELYDLLGFIHHLLEQDNIDPVIQQDAQNVQDVFTEAIIREHHGSYKTGAYGLSIYFPDSFMDGLSLDYGSRFYGLDFTRDTFWNEFIGLYVLTAILFDGEIVRGIHT